MREIKFRGKRVDNGEWIEGNLFKNECATRIIPYHAILFGQNELDEVYGVIPETVGQFTGLTDKNGKEIYDGDILVHSGGLKYFVVFINFRWMITNGTAYYDFNQIERSSAEIIGNVHDNPELLK